jgi:hypothetical protein
MRTSFRALIEKASVARGDVTRAAACALFAHRFGAALAARLIDEQVSPRRAMIAVRRGHLVSSLFLTKAIELAGFRPTMLTSRENHAERYCRLNTSLTVRYLGEFAPRASAFPSPSVSASASEAKPFPGPTTSLDELLDFRYRGVRVGRLAASAFLHHHKRGRVDLASPDVRDALQGYVERSMKACHMAERVLEEVRPELVMFTSYDYTPFCELLEVALARGVDCATWVAFGDGILLHRWTRETLECDYSRLSPALWDALCAVPWNDARRAEVRDLLYRSYTAEPWYGYGHGWEMKAMSPPGELRARLRLDPDRKTAVVFAHIPWDGAFFWGRNLFDDYEEWLVETIRAAVRNTRVNWVIKLHPLQVGESAELEATLARITAGAPHITLLPAAVGVNTWSVLQITDYCVTVRGTVGMEAAALGVPVLTAGTGRYEAKGFTIDSSSREAYLERVETIDRLPRLTADEVDLAQRYLYGLFKLRPLKMETISFKRRWYSTRARVMQVAAADPEAWRRAADMNAIARWLADPRRSPERVDPDVLTSLMTTS